MEPGDLTHFAQEPWTLVFVIPIIGAAVWLCLVWLGWIGVRPSHRSRIVLYSVILILTPFVPARVLLTALRSMVVIPVATLILLIVQATPWGRRTIALPTVRRAIQRVRQSGLAVTTDPAPRGLRRCTRELARLGFECIANVKEGDRSTGCVLFRPFDGLIAHLMPLPLPIKGLPRQLVTVFSVVSGRRGILSSSNGGVEVESWWNEISEILPGADMDTLVASHLRARTLLERDGVSFEIPLSPDVLEIASWTAREGATVLSRLSDDALLASAKGIVRSPKELSSIHQDAATLERIAVLRG